MYLTNIHNETDLGLLQIARQDKKRSVALDLEKRVSRIVSYFSFVRYKKEGNHSGIVISIAGTIEVTIG